MAGNRDVSEVVDLEITNVLIQRIEKAEEMEKKWKAESEKQTKKFNEYLHNLKSAKELDINVTEDIENLKILLEAIPGWSGKLHVEAQSDQAGKQYELVQKVYDVLGTNSNVKVIQPGSGSGSGSGSKGKGKSRR